MANKDTHSSCRIGAFPSPFVILSSYDDYSGTATVVCDALSCRCLFGEDYRHDVFSNQRLSDSYLLSVWFELQSGRTA